jgi:membrane fusion protein, macrolide-specific efflux system
MAKIKSLVMRFRWLSLFFGLALASTLVWALTNRDAALSENLTAPVVRGKIENTVLSAGVLQPAEFVDLGAQTSGQLKTLHVKLGDSVKKGQLLAEIDPVLSTAKLAEAEATLDDLVAQRRAKQEQLTLASLQKKRGDLLLAKDALARSEAEIMNANFRVAAASVSSLDAQIKHARALLDTARANLGYTRIMSPMDGEVISIAAREGQTLNASQQAPTLMRIAKLDNMTVWAQVAEADVSRLKAGQDAYFTVLGNIDERRKSKVRQVLPAPEIINNVIFYNALIDVPNKERDLKVQMTAQVSFVLQEEENALIIPFGALKPSKSDGKFSVRVLLPDGTIEKRSIKLGVRNAMMAQVTAGLQEGDTVVIGEDDANAKKKSESKKSSLSSKVKARS